MNNQSVNLIAESIDRFFETSINDAQEISPSYVRLLENAQRLMSSGGKRLRPKFTLLAYEAFGGEDTESIIPVAAAQELLHFALLIHDDIIDRDYVRYGTANIAGQYTEIYQPYLSNNEADAMHFSHSAALLAGDLMISGAHKLIAASHLEGHQIASAQALLSRGIFNVAGGELLDTELSFMPYTTGDALLVAKHKTASYSFVLPFLTGATLAGANEETCTLLEECGNYLGIAYQLTDDILGVFGSSEKTGKSNSSDITEGKRTYLVEKALQIFTENEMSIFMKSFGNATASDEEIEAARNLLETSGARAQTENAINDYTQRAFHTLDKLNLSPDYRAKFAEIFTLLTHRSY